MNEDNLKRFFSIYFQYIEVELFTSMLESSLVGRNTDVIITFQDTFYLLVCKNMEEKDIKKALDDLQEVTKKYANNSHFKLDKRHLNYQESTKIPVGFFDNPKFTSLLKEYQVAYQDFLQYLPHIDLSEDVRQRFQIRKKEQSSILVQAVLEFNNALAHIANIIYYGKDDNNNLGKAQNHLYRAILDYYKMLLRFIIPQINIPHRLIECYHQIRINEFLQLGKDIKDKDFTTRYKELFNECMQLQPVKAKQTSKVK
ncbi:hypothetical protein LS68_008205 [Helicobacter sp. MIT 05-5293]|uniref:hypothetical protein n=1 Tax=Helicobacter sp. MIT 05-5293 TaxID=1548149 RepID=UPI00051CDDFE|nr:hypothetical protein [Helicobacter sp. MIT 05-5293]TLD80191.1 hypothetical protein LS68_008205 [Helicobacter sp. MIT 05-5293]